MHIMQERKEPTLAKYELEMLYPIINAEQTAEITNEMPV